MGNNYKLVNVNNVSTVVSKDYYDDISTNQEDTKNAKVPMELKMNYRFLKLNEYQRSKLELKYRELNVWFPWLSIWGFEGSIFKLCCEKLGITNSEEHIEQINDFIIDSINHKNEFFINLVPACKRKIEEITKQETDSMKTSTQE